MLETTLTEGRVEETVKSTIAAVMTARDLDPGIIERLARLSETLGLRSGTSPDSAPAPAGGAASLVGRTQPLAVIRFDRPNVNYEPALFTVDVWKQHGTILRISKGEL